MRVDQVNARINERQARAATAEVRRQGMGVCTPRQGRQSRHNEARQLLTTTGDGHTGHRHVHLARSFAFRSNKK
jgi:hypothetical protein